MGRTKISFWKRIKRFFFPVYKTYTSWNYCFRLGESLHLKKYILRCKNCGAPKPTKQIKTKSTYRNGIFVDMEILSHKYYRCRYCGTRQEKNWFERELKDKFNNDGKDVIK